MTGFRLACYMALLLSAFGNSVVSQSDATGPLDDEDIVRMVLSDVSTESILKQIEEREVSFDVSPEMLDELRLAGVPESVVQAMLERQRTLEAAGTVEDPAPRVDYRLQVRLNPGSKAGHIVLQRQFEQDLAERLRLDPSVEPHFGDLAVFLACRTAEHVPDHWRGKSPLGRDFVSMPRHRLLAFVSGAEVREERIGTGKTLRLDLPDSLEFIFEDEARHDLDLGIAVQADGRYYRITRASIDGVAVGPEGLDLDGTVQSSRAGLLRDLGVTLVKPADGDDDDS